MTPLHPWLTHMSLAPSALPHISLDFLSGSIPLLIPGQSRLLHSSWLSGHPVSPPVVIPCPFLASAPGAPFFGAHGFSHIRVFPRGLLCAIPWSTPRLSKLALRVPTLLLHLQAVPVLPFLIPIPSTSWSMVVPLLAFQTLSRIS
jgi:hypothetical protein